MALNVNSLENSVFPNIADWGDEILIKNIDNYLQTSPHYNDLYNYCNDKKYIQSLINPLLSELDTLVPEAFEQLKNQLSQQISLRQAQQDKLEEVQNKNHLLEHQTNLEALQNTIRNIQAERIQAQANYVTQLSNDEQTTIDPQAVLDHISKDHELTTKISTYKNQIQNIESQQNDLINKENERIKRQQMREKFSPSDHPVLTDDQQKKLITDLKNLLNNQSYSIFLKQFALQIERLNYLSPQEKNNLRALQIQSLTQIELEQFNNELQALCHQYNNTIKALDKLNLTNKILLDTTEQLKEKLTQLKQDKIKIETVQNHYLIPILSTTGLLSIGSMSALFLLNSSALVPILAPIAAILGLATIGLTIAFCIYSHNKQTTLANKQQILLDNQNVLSKNNQIITTYQNSELPNLANQIRQLQEKITSRQQYKNNPEETLEQIPTPSTEPLSIYNNLGMFNTSKNENSFQVEQEERFDEINTPEDSRDAYLDFLCN